MESSQYFKTQNSELKCSTPLPGVPVVQCHKFSLDVIRWEEKFRLKSTLNFITDRSKSAYLSFHGKCSGPWRLESGSALLGSAQQLLCSRVLSPAPERRNPRVHKGRRILFWGSSSMSVQSQKKGGGLQRRIWSNLAGLPANIPPLS
jgi:hypothetical protein